MLLTISSAQKLLKPITGSRAKTVQHISNTNDVFRVTTVENENYFVKGSKLDFKPG
jgi:hypothetical protein